MDMECAKAELDEARQDLDPAEDGWAPSLQRAGKVLGVACTALLLLLVAAIPRHRPHGTEFRCCGRICTEP